MRRSMKGPVDLVGAWFQYRERFCPFAAWTRGIFYYLGLEVSIPRKGWPLCGQRFVNGLRGFVHEVSIPRKGWPLCGCWYFTATHGPMRKFQYRERVGPFAALTSQYSSLSLPSRFNTAKGLAPLRPIASCQPKDLERNGVSIPRKGWPLCGSQARHFHIPSYIMVSIPRKGWPLCGKIS